jgi:hypothetical protein
MTLGRRVQKAISGVWICIAFVRPGGKLHTVEQEVTTLNGCFVGSLLADITNDDGVGGHRFWR